MLAELLAGVADKAAGWDAVADLARPLPLRVIMRVLGFPAQDEHRLHAWADIVEEWFGGQGPLVPR